MSRRRSERRGLLAALAVLAVFMVGEAVAGVLAHSLVLLSDAGHMLADVVALLVAVIASRIAARPAKGAYTYGFARVDALSGQASGITLVVLAVVFTVEAIRRLLHPSDATGAVIVIVAAIGVIANLTATAFATSVGQGGHGHSGHGHSGHGHERAGHGRAGNGELRSLNVRGAVAHLVTDLWAFAATLVAGVVIIATGWTRADAVASLVIAALMTVTGFGLIRAAGRVFLEAAPAGLDPGLIGAELAACRGVAEVHDLHVWEITTGRPALSAHVLVDRGEECHEISEELRTRLAAEHGIEHVTLQVDHAGSPHDEHCAEVHGPVHTRPAPS